MGFLDRMKTSLAAVGGSVETAYLVIKDYREAANASAASEPALPNDAQKAFDSQIADRADGLSLSSKTAAAIAQKRASLGTAGGGSTQKTLVSKDKTFRVQFNPSEVQLYGTTLPKMQANATATGPQSIANAVNKPRVEMTTSLYFDAMNITDSFMWDKFSGGVSAQTIANITAAAAMKHGKIWSVQPQVEMLIAALRNPHTRNVGFFWSKFEFMGQITGVMAQYTMFSVSGHPVRAKVDLRLRQEMDPDMLQNWYADLDTAFGAGGRIGQKLGSLLNVGY